MNKEIFKEKMFELMRPLDEVVLAMPDKGDKCCDSQKICLIGAINNLEAIVNGVTDEDFKEEE